MPKFFMNNFQIRELLNLLLGGRTENGKILIKLIEINLSTHYKTQLGNEPHPPPPHTHKKKFLKSLEWVTNFADGDIKRTNRWSVPSEVIFKSTQWVSNFLVPITKLR